MKKLFKLFLLGVLLSVTSMFPAHAFKLQELPRDTAEQISQRLVYLWNDDTGVAVSRFKPLADEVMVLKAIYAAKQKGSEEFFLDSTSNPEFFQQVDSNQNLVVDLSNATQYFFGRDASVTDVPASAYIKKEEIKTNALPYTVHVKSISPNVGPRMYIVTYVADGTNENNEPNLIGRIDATVTPCEDAPLGWSVVQYEITKFNKEQPVEQEPVAEKVTYAADAFFDFDKSVVKPEGQTKLDELVSSLLDKNFEAIIVEGHTDSIGSEAYNNKLSTRRAEAVKTYLVSKGINAQKVFTEGKGELEPLESNKTKEGRAKNRRVEIEVVITQGVTQ